MRSMINQTDVTAEAASDSKFERHMLLTKRVQNLVSKDQHKVAQHDLPDHTPEPN